MKRKRIIKLSSSIAAMLLAAGYMAFGVCADGPGALPYYEDVTENPVQTEEPPAEQTDEPIKVVYPQPDETTQQQSEDAAETRSLLEEIKSMVSGIKNSNYSEPAKSNTADAMDSFSSMLSSMELITPTPTHTPVPTPIPKITETDGNGYIVEDTQMLADGKEFITMASKDGTEFYMVIDRAKDNEVYLLNKFDNTDLAAFIESSPSPEPTEEVTASPEPTPTAEPEADITQKEEKTGVGAGTIIFMIVIAGGVAVGFYLFRNSSGNEEEDDDDEEELDEESEYTENEDDDDEDEDFPVMDEDDDDSEEDE